jgi:hypothetical protein
MLQFRFGPGLDSSLPSCLLFCPNISGVPVAAVIGMGGLVCAKNLAISFCPPKAALAKGYGKKREARQPEPRDFPKNYIPIAKSLITHAVNYALDNRRKPQRSICAD